METTELQNKIEMIEQTTWDVLKEKLGGISTRYKKQMFALGFLIGLCLVITIWSYIPPFNDISWHRIPGLTKLPPSWEHWLGTDTYGSDRFNLLLTGIRNSLAFGLLAASICSLLALLVGVVGPFLGGWADNLSQLLTNIILVIPILPFIILLGSLSKGPTVSYAGEASIWLIVLVIALLNWPWAARSIRSQVLTLKERNFVKISRMSAIGNTRIAFTEVLPNVLSYVILSFTIITGIAIQTEAAIAMVGFGQTEYTTLGYLLYYSFEHGDITAFRWYGWVPHGIILTLFLLLIYSVHGSFLATFNPRTREK